MGYYEGKKFILNQKFEFVETDIQGLILIKPFVAEDLRGSFVKDYSQEVFNQNNFDYDLKEIFYTYSHKGVIRALHFQRVKQQAKLVRCVFGKVFDVVVDLRKGSPTFCFWLGFDLNDSNNHEVLVPKGCAHGYLVLEKSIVSYKCDEKFYPEFDDGIMWDDPDIGVDWPLELVNNKVILAEKDKNLQSFKQFQNTYGGF